MRVQEKVDFNEAAVKRLSKAEFLKAHDHLADHVDLGAEYDRITGNGEDKASSKSAPAEGKKAAEPKA